VELPPSRRVVTYGAVITLATESSKDLGSKNGGKKLRLSPRRKANVCYRRFIMKVNSNRFGPDTMMRPLLKLFKDPDGGRP